MNIKLHNVPTNHLAVVETEGRHTRVLGFYPDTPEGKRRAHHRWEKAYMAICEELARVPAMLREISVTIVRA